MLRLRVRGLAAAPHVQMEAIAVLAPGRNFVAFPEVAQTTAMGVGADVTTILKELRIPQLLGLGLGLRLGFACPVDSPLRFARRVLGSDSGKDSK